MWDVGGRTVLVTGATSGIGLELSVALARRGAKVVMVGRDPARTERAQAEIRSRSGSKEVSFLLGDFASLAAVRSVAQSFRATHDRLDVLVNNAGGVNKNRRLTADGFETTFAVNHLAPFLLTGLLFDLLLNSSPARVVTVASIGHRRGSLDFDDLSFERGYSIMKAYARSKLANVLFANELARRLRGTGVTSNSVHPGGVSTNIWSGAPWWAKPLIQIAFRPFFITAEKGGGYVESLVVRPDLEGVTGKYFEEAAMMEPSSLARDQALAARLWQVSESMVGLQNACPPPANQS